MQNWIGGQRQGLRLSIWIVPLLMIFSLAGCGRLPFGDRPASVSAQVSADTANQTGNQTTSGNAFVSLQPASGYGGLYVQVSGENWPRNMMVLVTLEDDQGRSETLAAADTDQAGNLTTGFLFPIDERWLSSGSLWVVTTTADGSIETKAKFTVVPPGTEVAMTSSSTETATSETIQTETAEDGKSDAAANETAGSEAANSEATESKNGESEQDSEHKVVLPLVSASGVERSSNQRNRRSSSSGRVIQAKIDIKPERSRGINCRDGQEWVTVVIFSSADFDATSVEPESVVVASGGDLGYHSGAAENTFVALALPSPVQSNLSAYQWQWHLDDVDGDGTIDLVMELRFDYTELTCDAAVAAVTGRTKDGNRFEGSDSVKMFTRGRS